MSFFVKFNNGVRINISLLFAIDKTCSNSLKKLLWQSGYERKEFIIPIAIKFEFIVFINDAAIAMSNISLGAYASGLGTCWIAAFREEEIKKILNIPSNVRVFAMTPLGYPDEKKGPVKKRKLLEELVHYEKW